MIKNKKIREDKIMGMIDLDKIMVRKLVSVTTKYFLFFLCLYKNNVKGSVTKTNPPKKFGLPKYEE